TWLNRISTRGKQPWASDSTRASQNHLLLGEQWRPRTRMTELSGILEGVGLPAIARFLYGLKKTGCLHLVEYEWHGEVFFEEGKITTARLGSRTGMSAVEAILETLPAARFSLDSQSPTPADSRIELSQDEILKRLDEVAALVAYSKPRMLAPEVIPVLLTGDA